MMADPGFLPGFINVGIDMAIGQIIHHVGIAVTCKRELESLRDLVTTIEPMVTQIHRCRLELNRKRERGTSTAGSDINVLEINTCITNLHALLQRALTVVQECSVPSCNVFSRYQSSRRITTLISEIEKHLKLQVPLVQLQMQQQQMQMQRDSAQPSSSTSATTSEGLAPTTGGFLIQEPLIVGQEKAFTILEMWLIDIANVNSIFSIGIVGKGGSGKTLLLKRLFSNQKVRDFFSDGFLLWLTVSQSPSLTSLRYELCRQVAMQTNAEFSQNMMEEDAKNWLNQRMRGKRFSLFLDDVWGEGGKLLEDLGVALLTDHSSNSKIIVSSRDRRALLEMGVSENSTITVGDLVEKDSWDLFAYHAFAYNGRNLPANIGETTAKLVCAKCGGLPLAIKVVGRSMAGITDPEEWKLAVRRLPNEKKQDRQALYDALRWSYDSLGNYHVNLQMCFLYLAAAFTEDQVVHVKAMLIPLWVGEGLLAHNRLRDQPGLHEDQIAKIYVNVLADRCLIEPILRDIDGRVVTFRVHDVIHALAIQIAEVEEKFYCRTGMALTVLAPNDCSGCTRLMLNDNELTSLPQLWRAPQLCSLLMARNNLLTEIPRKVIGSMISLKVLDLSGTSLKSLPESVGCLKQLVCFNLVGVPIKRLPASLTTLVNLQFLDLGSSAITELPSDIDRLRCLRYLRMYECNDLQYLPCSISGLTSLEMLNMSYCSKVWAKRDKKRRWKKVASIGHLSTLTQLKLLRVQNNGETIREGTLGSMLQMETLHLQLTAMTYVPDDIFNMSKLRRFSLECSHVLKMESKFWEFQHLGHLQLWNCRELEELPDLHKLSSLKQLDIFKCISLKKIPKEFSERGAFSSLEIFSLVDLDKLEELPLIKEGAMPMLKIFTMMNCEALQMLPESYLNLKTLHKVRLYGCPMVSENLHRVKIVDTRVKVVTMSTRDTKEVIKKFMQVRDSKIGWSYGEFWYNELWLFLRELYTPI